MHTYSSDASDRSWAPWALACVAVGLTYACSRALTALNASWPWWIENPSIMLFYGALWALYNKFLWRRSVLCFPLSRIPDVSGTWSVVVQSSHGPGRHSTGFIRIYQTWSKILIEFENSSSRSVSRMAALNLEPGANQGLIYEYANDPRFSATESMHAHRGVALLRISTDGRRLDGEYFTGRDRQTHGALTLRWMCSRQLDHNEAQSMYEKDNNTDERQAAAN